MFNLRDREKTKEAEKEVFGSWLSRQYMFCPT
jgi:hypothetical protein